MTTKIARRIPESVVAKIAADWPHLKKVAENIERIGVPAELALANAVLHVESRSLTGCEVLGLSRVALGCSWNGGDESLEIGEWWYGQIYWQAGGEDRGRPVDAQMLNIREHRGPKRSQTRWNGCIPRTIQAATPMSDHG